MDRKYRPGLTTHRLAAVADEIHHIKPCLDAEAGKETADFAVKDKLGRVVGLEMLLE